MRASIIASDPGYRHDAPRVKVYLDGQLVKDCVTADEEAGEVWRYDWGPDGKLTVEDGKLKLKKHTGKVEIKVRERA